MPINSIIDARIPQPTATNQILVWNNTTGLFEASVSLSGLTLNSPVISGPLDAQGKILANGGFIGDTDDDELISIDGAGGIVTVDGGIIANDTLIAGTSFDIDYILNVLGADGAAGTGSVATGLGQAIRCIGGVGGTAAAPFGAAGSGGIVEIQGGIGGASDKAPVGIGGFGGAFTLVGGFGGNCNGVAANTGGIGGGFSMLSGLGGDASGGTSNTGGDGGLCQIIAGDGGEGDTSDGAGGNIRINAGMGSVDGSIFIGNDTGNVRIGDLTIPTEKLEVAGNAVATGDVSGATLTAGDGFTGTGAYTTLTIVNGIITNAV